MINVKLVVLFGFIVSVLCRDKYCEICSSHTLCKYPKPGPSTTCKNYDHTALLAKYDIEDIVNRINERRNFVASGFSRNLPPAANMRKIEWSEELATFAQRWADQCDPSIRPDKEDFCRDLPEKSVGQSIATVYGPSPGLNVKSLIDVWYTQILDYKGSVSYYNRSSDTRTNYFTQLIWAETDTVGCGKARFFIQYGNTMIERLVCNFAQKGNVHGKTVYAIGFGGTQCPENMRPDEKLSALCSYTIQENKTTSPGPQISSSLRILNLSNNSTKHEIDPIKNNIKQMNLEGNKTKDQRNQKTRHVFFNNTYAGIPLARPPFRHPQIPFVHPQQMHWNYVMNNTRNPEFRRYQQSDEKGHSRVYHGHDHGNTSPSTSISKGSSEQNFRRFDFSTEPITSSNFRKNFPFQQCTRKPPDCAPPMPPFGNMCTRGIKSDCMPPGPPCPVPCPVPHPLPAPPPYGLPLTPLPPPQFHPPDPPFPPPAPPFAPPAPHFPPPPPHYPPPNPQFPPPAPPFPPPPPDLCSCSTQRCLTTTPCGCNMNCQCPHMNFPIVGCPHAARRQEDQTKDETRKSSEFHYYDLFPNIAIRSGDTDSRKSPSIATTSSNKNSWLSKSSTIDSKYLKTLSFKRREFHQHHRQVNDGLDNPNYIDHERDYSYGSFDSSERQRREPEDQLTFKPFWQMDEYSHKQHPQLKAIKYTTLGNKRNKNTKRPMLNFFSETITIKLDPINHNDHEEHITEKYLSFDELMHLRKFNAEDYDARRQAKKAAAPAKTAATKAAATTTKKAAASTAKKLAATTTTKAAAAATKKEKKTKETTTTEATAPTEEYTTNTPFIRKKHCTRKLTCTWTAPTMTANDGSIIEIGNKGGSRTPPGYIEGCTRTSTCTRDFINRNKLPSTTTEQSSVVESDTDEDYCERRSLNVQRRNSDDEGAPVQSSGYLVADTDSSTSTSQYISEKSNFISNPASTSAPINDCVCYEENHRNKRDSRKNNKYIITQTRKNCNGNGGDSQYTLSYGDLYYLLVKKIIERWKEKKDSMHSGDCPCNNSKVIQNCKVLMYFIVLSVITIN